LAKIGATDPEREIIDSYVENLECKLNGQTDVSDKPTAKVVDSSGGSGVGMSGLSRGMNLLSNIMPQQMSSVRKKMEYSIKMISNPEMQNKTDDIGMEVPCEKTSLMKILGEKPGMSGLSRGRNLLSNLMPQQMISDPKKMEHSNKIMSNPEMQNGTADIGMEVPCEKTSLMEVPCEKPSLMGLLTNPAKLRVVLAKVYHDPKTKDWMDQNKEAAALLNRIKSFDIGAGFELLKKPGILAKIRFLLEKHI